MGEARVEPSVLERECLRFAAYLVDQKPDAYVVAKYHEGHGTGSIVGRETLDSLDSLLLRVASGPPMMTKLVDAYTAIFLKKATVRRKWMLLLAILETCAPSYRHFDSPDSAGRGWMLLGLLWGGLAFVTALSVSVVVFGPFHVSVRVSQGLRGRR